MQRGQPQNRYPGPRPDTPSRPKRNKRHDEIWEEICSQVRLMESKQQKITPEGD